MGKNVVPYLISDALQPNQRLHPSSLPVFIHTLKGELGLASNDDQGPINGTTILGDTALAQRSLYTLRRRVK